MFIRVQTTDFKTGVDELMNGASKAIINITAEGNTLYIQRVGSLIYDVKIPLIDKVERRVSITVEMPAIIDLLVREEETTLIIDETVLAISQKGFDLTLKSLHEERVPIEALKREYTFSLSKVVIADLAKTVTILDKYAKALSTGESSIHFTGEQAIIMYSNLVFVQDIKTYPMVLTAMQIKELSRAVKSQKVEAIQVGIDKEHSMASYSTSMTSKTVWSYSPVRGTTESETLETLNKRIKREVTTNFREIDRLQALFKYVSKQYVNVNVYNNGVQFQTNNNHSITVGLKGDDLGDMFSIGLSIDQLKMLAPILERQVDIGMGGDIIRWKTGYKYLLMSGKSY